MHESCGVHFSEEWFLTRCAQHMVLSIGQLEEEGVPSWGVGYAVFEVEVGHLPYTPDHIHGEEGISSIAWELTNEAVAMLGEEYLSLYRSFSSLSFCLPS